MPELHRAWAEDLSMLVMPTHRTRLRLRSINSRIFSPITLH